VTDQDQSKTHKAALLKRQAADLRIQAAFDASCGQPPIWQPAKADDLDRQAAELLAPSPDTPVSASGEVVPIRGNSPTIKQTILRDTLKVPNVIAQEASIKRTDLLLQPNYDVLALGLDTAATIGASNSIEKMLAHQMALAHDAAFKMMDKAGSFYQRGGLSQAESIEYARLSATAAKLMRVFQEGALTLQRLRTGGAQTVTVQHVHVAEGAQAVIGNVQAGGNPGGGRRQKMIYPMHSSPRCGAHARTTGQPCKSPAMANGRCRMHGGKSTGRPITHGRNTEAAKQQRRETREILRTLRALLD
jgi:hypothetical protein